MGKWLAGALAAMSLAPCPATAAVIDFESLTPGAIGSSYSEDGFTLSATRSFTALSSSGSIALAGPNPFDFSSSPLFTLTEAGGGAFDVHSLLIFAADGNGLGVPISFSAVTGGGATISHTAHLPEYGFAPVPATQTLVVLPNSFRSVVSVTWQQGAEFHQFDDITVALASAPVPEPSTWAMLIAGFALVGAAARRKPYPLANATRQQTV